MVSTPRGFDRTGPCDCRPLPTIYVYICIYIYICIIIYIHDILNSCCIWNVNLRFGFIFAWLTSTGPVIMVFGYFLMPCVFCALSVCILFGFFGVVGVFGIVGFGEWKFTFWLRPYPAHFLTACDDGICVLCYAVCFLRPGYIIMRASGS